jgi:uncharacterized membrane protein
MRSIACSGIELERTQDMESKAKLFGHPIHQMLVVFPFGLLVMAILFDVMFLATGNSTWSDIAYGMIAAGVLSGLVAAPFGFIDWLGIPSGTRAKRIGLVHGVANAIMLLLYGMSWAQRGANPREPQTIAFVFAFAGCAVALFAGWLGGELVDRLAVGVDDGANLNAPNSLTTPHVRE